MAIGPTNEDIDMMMLLSRLLSTLTRPQWEEFPVFSKTNKIMVRQYFLNSNINSISILTTKQQLRTIFCDGLKLVQQNNPHLGWNDPNPPLIHLLAHLQVPSDALSLSNS